MRLRRCARAADLVVVLERDRRAATIVACRAARSGRSREACSSYQMKSSCVLSDHRDCAVRVRVAHVTLSVLVVPAAADRPLRDAAARAAAVLHRPSESTLDSWIRLPTMPADCALRQALADEVVERGLLVTRERLLAHARVAVIDGSVAAQPANTQGAQHGKGFSSRGLLRKLRTNAHVRENPRTRGLAEAARAASQPIGCSRPCSGRERPHGAGISSRHVDPCRAQRRLRGDRGDHEPLHHDERDPFRLRTGDRGRAARRVVLSPAASVSRRRSRRRLPPTRRPTGGASAPPTHGPPSSASTCEPGLRGRGIGSPLTSRCSMHASAAGFHSAIAGITMPNERLGRAARRLGFEHGGHGPRCRLQARRWHAVAFYPEDAVHPSGAADMSLDHVTRVRGAKGAGEDGSRSWSRAATAW